MAKAAHCFEALESNRQGISKYFRGFDRGIASGLAIRHDQGRAYMSDGFQAERAFLEKTKSPSIVRDPEGKGIAERFIRTLKEKLLWIRAIATVAELVETLPDFRRRHIEHWLIERHGFRTPNRVKFDLATASKRLDIGMHCRRVG